MSWNVYQIIWYIPTLLVKFPHPIPFTLCLRKPTGESEISISGNALGDSVRLFISRYGLIMRVMGFHLKL